MTRLLLLLTGCLSLLISSCAPTGDWNEDSLFFSPRMGTDRLAAMSAQVDRINAQTAASRRRTAGLEARVRQGLSSKRSAELEHEGIKREIKLLEEELCKRHLELNRIDTSNAELAGQVQSIQTEISITQSRLSRLRDQLEIAIRAR